MKKGRIKNPLGSTLFAEVEQTTTAWERMRGLLGSHSLNAEQGMLIKPCNMVHTAFMPFPIDLIFLDKLGNILSLVENLQPWRIAVRFSAEMVLEIRAGMIHKLKLTRLSKLVWEDQF